MIFYDSHEESVDVDSVIQINSDTSNVELCFVFIS